MLTSEVNGSFINGEWDASSAEQADVCDPADGSVVGRFRRAGEAEVERAVDAAAAAAPAWASAGPAARAALLERAAALLATQVDEWAELMTREMGKPLPEARLECARASKILRYYAGEAQRPIGEHYAADAPGTWLFTRRRPVGVVALITPWNFPAAIPTWKLAPALIYGNTVVVKLAEAATLTGLFLVRALQEAGIPRGVVNALTGPGSTIGPALVRHPAVRALSFTGSAAVGAQIRADAAVDATRVQLELGGQNPVIVRADADLGLAAAAVGTGAFASAGQKCTATRRVFVAEERYDEFLSLLTAHAEALRPGPPLQEGVTLGPLVNASAMREVLDAVDRAADAGRIVTGGGQLTDGELSRGCFVAPTVVADLPADAELARDEVFGPVTAVWPVSSDEEALRRANDTEYGLSAAVFTRDLTAAKDFVEQIAVGLVHVNSQTAGADVHVPFGGLRASGYGPHEQGRAAIEFYTDQQTVYLDGTP